MIHIAEALALVVKHAGLQLSEPTPLTNALGLTLVDPILADADSPPFDKAMMDGFAIRAADFANGTREFRATAGVRAGYVSDNPVNSGEAAGITTGAPLPPGADAVVPIEQCTRNGDSVRIDLNAVAVGLNVLTRGSEYRTGDTVLESGRRLGPAELALAAGVGCTMPSVRCRPRVAILSTGDEIVPAHTTPGPGQIRNSNTPLLEALLQAVGAESTVLTPTHDDRKLLRAEIRNGLGFDLLLLTGGVSAGNFDFVPAALADCGVERIFHKVALKPGAPVWFGVHERGLAFGLPGNPISVLVCFELFVNTALRARQQRRNPLPPALHARLLRDFEYPTKRETYHPARLAFSETGPVVEPVSWFGSADVRGAAQANALLVCPVGAGIHSQGANVRVLPLSRVGWDWPCSGIG